MPTEPSDMSFAVSLASRTFEWSSRGLNALFATRSNLLSPTFAGMLADLVRFSRCAVPKWGGGGRGKGVPASRLTQCHHTPAAMRDCVSAGKVPSSWSA